jgi:hypothetical protein
MTLLNESGLHGGWHWCYHRSILEQTKFQATVKQEAAKDRLEVESVPLLALDHFNDLEDGKNWTSDIIIAGTRHPELTDLHAKNKTGLRPFARYSEWETSVWTKSLLRHRQLVEITSG